MGKADTIKSKVNAALNKIGGPTSTAYKRVTTITGGDQFIGRPGSISYTDTLLTPQPYVNYDGKGNGDVLSTASEVLPAGGVSMIFSPTSITEAELADDNLVIVLKDSVGGVLTFTVLEYRPYYIEKTNVGYKVLLRRFNK